MNVYRKLCAITILCLFVLIQTSLQECYEKLYRTKENSTCKVFGRYSRTCTEYYKQNFYELHCYMLTDGIQETKYNNDVYYIEIYSSNINVTAELFNSFKKVISITIQDSNITDISPNAFVNLTNLETLNFTDNNINVLYKRPFNTLTKLDSLDLSKNNISVIEDNLLDGSVSLKRLVLTNNKIFDVSPLLNNCGNLSSLKLSRNNIEQIEFTSGCSQLEILTLDNNNIKNFNVKIQETSALLFLDLSQNNIDHIEGESLKHFVNLHLLDLSKNPLFEINALPVNLFQNLLELQYLGLSQTGIQNIVLGTFTKLFGLRLLDLSHNELTNLPRGLFHDLSNIETIKLNNNYLTSFEYDDYIRGQTTIDLNNNLWDCDMLIHISRVLRERVVFLEPGSVHNTSNIRGIACFKNEQKISSQEDILDKGNLYDFNEFQKDLHQILAQQENILNISKNFFEYIKNNMTNSPRIAGLTENSQETNNFDGVYKSMVVGIYFILFISIVGLFLLSLLLLKRYKIIGKPPQEEMKTLNNFEM